MVTQVDYDGRVFRSISNSAGGDVDAATRFHYHQRDRVVTGTYSGGGVREGVLIGLVAEDGSLDLRYAHVAADGGLMTGRCDSVVQVLDDGRYRLHETWEWTGGGQGSGVSVVEEERSDSA
jgi:hypothetical protein